MKLNAIQKVNLGPLAIDLVSKSDLIDLIADAARDKNSLTVCTPNLQFYGTIKKDPSKGNLCRAFDFSIADGWPISLAATLKSKKRVRRIIGSDLFPLLLDKNKDSEIDLLIIGGHRKDAHKIESRFKHLKNVFVVIPPENLTAENLVKFANHEQRLSLRPRIVIICLGFPLQEEVGLQIAKLWNSPVICLGASLDFYIGTKQRAPWIFRKLLLEWLWRLISEPKRLWRRYLLVSVPSIISLIKDVFYD